MAIMVTIDFSNQKNIFVDKDTLVYSKCWGNLWKYSFDIWVDENPHVLKTEIM